MANFKMDSIDFVIQKLERVNETIDELLADNGISTHTDFDGQTVDWQPDFEAQHGIAFKTALEQSYQGLDEIIQMLFTTKRRCK